MVLAEFAMFPTDKGESVSTYVAPILKIIDEYPVSYQVTSMGTILEGSWEDVMEVISLCFRQMRQQSNRISINMKIDYRLGDKPRMTAKVEKLETILQSPLQHSASGEIY